MYLHWMEQRRGRGNSGLFATVGKIFTLHLNHDRGSYLMLPTILVIVPVPVSFLVQLSVNTPLLMHYGSTWRF